MEKVEDTISFAYASVVVRKQLNKNKKRWSDIISAGAWVKSIGNFLKLLIVESGINIG